MTDSSTSSPSSVLPPSIHDFYDTLLKMDRSIKTSERFGLQKVLKIHVTTETEVIEMSPQDFMEFSRRWHQEYLESLPSYRRAKEMKQEAIWWSLSKVLLKDEIEAWLATIANHHTKKNYRIGIEELFQLELLKEAWTLQQFSLYNPDLILDQIKTEKIVSPKNGKEWTTSTKQARAACFITLTKYLSRKTEGIIRHAVTCRHGINKTFSHRRKKVTTQALSRKQWTKFLYHLREISQREFLIAALTLNGGKRIGEVLSLKTEQIDYCYGEPMGKIRFHQSKSKFADDGGIISYPRRIMDDLKSYIGERHGHVFITRNGKPVRQTQIDRNFVKAGELANIPFRVSPHVLRASAITEWKKEDFQDSEIMRATGHSSSQMVYMYDKRDLEENVTKKVSLI